MKKYVLVGASYRCLGMYAKPMVEEFSDVVKIVGIFDINRTRANYIRNHTDPTISVYDSFDKMMVETCPDTAIITTVDRYHHEYIIKSLEYGCDVICEKPIAIDEGKCRAIIEAEKKSGKKVIVTFNYRFTPYVTKIKALLKQNIIGKVLSADFEYFLDTLHGADYFRRWHRRMENSGGLLVHKATHHFDLVNWWLEEDPVEVYANGSLRFYGSNGKEHGERCSNCVYQKTCKYAVTYERDTFMKEFYFEAEKEDGYYRDGCVFDASIDIYDSMSATVKYSGGTLLTYSLIAYSPYEGWRIVINGTGGRLEATEYHSGGRAKEPYYNLEIFDMNGNIQSDKVLKLQGNHGGGDGLIREMVFRGNLPDPLKHFANSSDGINSAMIGICANRSIREGIPFKIRDLLK